MMRVEEEKKHSNRFEERMKINLKDEDDATGDEAAGDMRKNPNNIWTTGL